MAEHSRRIGEFRRKQEEKHSKKNPFIAPEMLVASNLRPDFSGRTRHQQLFFLLLLIGASASLPVAEAGKSKRSERSVVSDSSLAPSPEISTSLPSAVSERQSVPITAEAPGASVASTLSNMGVFASPVASQPAPKDAKKSLSFTGEVALAPVRDPYWQVYFEPQDRDILAKPKLETKLQDTLDIEQPIIQIRGKPDQVAIIHEQLNKLLTAYDSEELRDELGLLSKGMPELRILVTSPQHLAQDVDGLYIPENLDIRYSAKSTQMEYFVLAHELAHIFDHWVAMVLEQNVVSTDGNYFYPKAKEEREKYRKLWQKGNNRVNKIVRYLNELSSLSSQPQTPVTNARIQELQTWLASYRQASQRLLEYPFVGRNNKLLVSFSKKELEDFRQLKIEFEIGNTVNLDPYLTAEPGGLKGRGPLTISNIKKNGDLSTIELVTGDPLIIFLRAHYNLQLNTFETPMYRDKPLWEIRAFTRQIFPEPLIKLVWKEAYEYQRNVRNQVALALKNNYKKPDIHSDADRFKLVAQQLKFKIKEDKVLLAKSRSDQDSIKSRLFKHTQEYIRALVRANQLDEALQVLTEAEETPDMLTTDEIALMAEVCFLQGAYDLATKIFDRFLQEDSAPHVPEKMAIVQYCYGVSLLKLARYKEAQARLTIALKTMKEDDAIEPEFIKLCQRQLKRAKAGLTPAPSSSPSLVI